MSSAWFSLEWFSPALFRSYSWENPLFLYGLAIIPLLFVGRWLWSRFFARKLPVALVKSDVRTSPSALLRFIPDGLLALTLALVVIALARPQKTNEKVEQWTEGIDIMVAMDVSQSMEIEDFTPNRLAAAKKMARQFIKGRLQDRIGLVIFSGDAYSLTPLSTDYDLLYSYLDAIDFSMIDSRGTAIGSALAVSINRMRESQSKSKVCILISDGESNAGNIDPITAAELAAGYSIRVYTILVGKEGLVPFGRDLFGRPQMVPNTVDETTMRKIAEIGDGEFFRVTDNSALERVFKRIDQYEKAEIKETRFRDTSDFYHIYLTWALVFWLLWLALRSTFLSNALQD
ncbi:MAG: VWA domain-containing protein [Bacteroidota bacterium]